MIPFRQRYTVEERRQECQRAKLRREGYVPTILERASPETPLIDKEKFMIPQDLNGAQLMYIIRRRIGIKPSQALFLLCNNKMVTSADTLRDIYSRCKNDEDGFLYITYALENVFGEKGV